MTDEWRSPSQQNEWEIWRPVADYEGMYEVSSIGSVRSLTRKVSNRALTGKLLKSCIGATGYRVVGLHKSGKSKQHKVHRLVAEAFLPPSANPWVCHKDGDCLNNTVENLYWGTKAENAQDRIKHGNHFQLKKTHCPKNHEYTPENTYMHRGGRSCRECRGDALRRFHGRD